MGICDWLNQFFYFLIDEVLLVGRILCHMFLLEVMLVFFINDEFF
jgi:hypothetical protein